MSFFLLVMSLHCLINQEVRLTSSPQTDPCLSLLDVLAFSEHDAEMFSDDDKCSFYALFKFYVIFILTSIIGFGCFGVFVIIIIINIIIMFKSAFKDRYACMDLCLLSFEMRS